MAEFDQLSGHKYAPGYEPTMLDRMFEYLLTLNPDTIFNFIVFAICLFLAARSTANILRHNRSYRRQFEREMHRLTEAEARKEAIRTLRSQRMRPVKS